MYKQSLKVLLCSCQRISRLFKMPGLSMSFFLYKTRICRSLCCIQISMQISADCELANDSPWGKPPSPSGQSQPGFFQLLKLL